MDLFSQLAADCAPIANVGLVAVFPLFGALVGYATVSFARAVGVKG